MSSTTTAASERGLAEHPQGEWLIDWPGLKAEILPAAKETGNTVELGPCPLCEGSGTLKIQLWDDTDKGNPTPVRLWEHECPCCTGEGDFPTRAEVRRLRQRVARRTARYAQMLVEVEAALEQLRPVVEALDAGRTYALVPSLPGRTPTRMPLDTMGFKNPETGERVWPLEQPDRVRQLLADHEARLLQVQLRASEVAEAVRGIDDLEAHLQYARRMYSWMRTATQETQRIVEAASAPPVPAAVPAAVPTCHCGKRGEAEVDGAWLCKRHAYAAGAVEHLAEVAKAENEIEVCDWCSQRPARRTFQGYHYCGPCADDAGLPEGEA